MTAPATTWAPATGAQKFGLQNSAPSPANTALSSISTPAVGDAAQASPTSPENPLFVFAVIAALTFGLMAFSTSVRVGDTTAAVSVGKT